MRKLDLEDNSIIWLEPFEQNFPGELITSLFDKRGLGEYRFFLWQLLKLYGQTCNRDELLVNQASCIEVYEEVMCLLEACYIQNTQTPARDEVASHTEPEQEAKGPVLVIPDSFENTAPIHRIIYMIVNSMDVEKIYKLGSYPLDLPNTGEEFDLLVLLKGGTNRPMDEYESLIRNRSHDMAVVYATVLPIERVNAMITDGNNFFVNACIPQNLIYDAKTIEIAIPASDTEKSLPGRYENEYTLHINNAESFLLSASKCQQQQESTISCFMLHQTVEQALYALMIPLTHYKIPTHNLGRLMRIVRRFSIEIYNVFPKNTKEEMRLFKLLQKAYIHGRYKDDFEVSKEDTVILMDRCTRLIQLVKERYRIHADQQQLCT